MMGDPTERPSWTAPLWRRTRTYKHEAQASVFGVNDSLACAASLYGKRKRRSSTRLPGSAVAANRRRGVAMIAALVALFVVTLIAGAWLRQMVAGQRQVRRWQWQMQAFWLAESAADRAVARLSVAPEYNGETWRVPAESLDGRAGVAEIRVEPVDGKPGQRRIVVEAHYPDDPINRISQSKELVVPILKSEDSP